MTKNFGVFTLMLFFSLNVGAKQTNTSDLAIHQQKESESINKQFTADDRKIILDILAQILNVMNKEKELTEAEPLFGRYIHVEPKMGILKWMRYNNKLASTNFYRKNRELGWIYASLSLDINNFTITDFKQNDFDSLDLAFDSIFEDTYVAIKAPNGMRLKELTNLPSYIYRFRFKSNNKIRLEFRVFPEMMNMNEKFPRNFTSASIYKEE